MRQDLRDAIERAYRVFAPYSVGDQLEVCRCNVCLCDVETERVLVTTPLRELAAPWLAEYTNSAHGYASGRIADELRHFLPRYFELIALDDPPCHLGLEFSLSRLGLVEWRTRWPAEEAGAISAFFSALFEDRVRDVRVSYVRSADDPVMVRDMDELLTFAAGAGADLRPLLRIWDEAPDPAASLHAAQFAADAADRTGAGLLVSDDWTRRLGDQPGYVAAWLERVETRRRVDAALAAARDDAHRAILARGLEALAPGT